MDHEKHGKKMPPKKMPMKPPKKMPKRMMDDGKKKKRR